jgi:hypothetical protein
MDPYHVLGVPNDCSLEELKDAFRTRALLAHPDRGGDSTDFIQLRDAFDQISKDLEKKPVVPTTTKQGHPSRRNRPPKESDPNWDPELIVRDEPLPRIRPARPRDPNWQPDLVVLDEETQSSRRPQSRDPKQPGQNDMRWLGGLSARSTAERRPSPTTEWNLSVYMVLLIVTIITIWICWSAWRSEPAPKPIGVETNFVPAQVPE